MKPITSQKSFAIPNALRERLFSEARAAYPNECCGLIEGVRHGEVIEVTALHAVRNLAREQDRFEIDPAEHIRLLRALRGTEREIVGCYHSHPDGAAEPSMRDHQGASEDHFVWLIAAVDATGSSEIGAHLFASGRFRKIAL